MGRLLCPARHCCLSTGITITVSQPEYSLQVREAGAEFPGDFLPGTPLLTNWNSPFPITLSFSQALFGSVLQVEPGQVQDTPAPFTAYLSAYEGSTLLGTVSVSGTKSHSSDGSAPFIGVEASCACITSEVVRVSVSTNGPYTGDLGVGPLSIQSAPEPPPSALLLVGLAMLAAWRFWPGRRKALWS